MQGEYRFELRAASYGPVVLAARQGMIVAGTMDVVPADLPVTIHADPELVRGIAT